MTRIERGQIDCDWQTDWFACQWEARLSRTTVWFETSKSRLSKCTSQSRSRMPCAMRLFLCDAARAAHCSTAPTKKDRPTIWPLSLKRLLYNFVVFVIWTCSNWAVMMMVVNRNWPTLSTLGVQFEVWTLGSTSRTTAKIALCFEVRNARAQSVFDWGAKRWCPLASGISVCCGVHSNALRSQQIVDASNERLVRLPSSKRSHRRRDPKPLWCRQIACD